MPFSVAVTIASGTGIWGVGGDGVGETGGRVEMLGGEMDGLGEGEGGVCDGGGEAVECLARVGDEDE